MDQRQTVAFELERVIVLRSGRLLLDEVTARIPAPGITVVTGPSGAGKTTLLRLLNRLEVPDGGRVCYHGQPLDELDPLTLRRRVGMVFQRPTPFPGSVADNLAVARPAPAPASWAPPWNGWPWTRACSARRRAPCPAVSCSACAWPAPWSPDRKPCC